MSSPLRYVPEGGALVEITLNCIQGRYLLRPDPAGEVNELVLGVVGRAQRLYQMPLVGICVLSSHLHALAIPEDAKMMADFMRYVAGNLSKEIGRLHDWPGKLWMRRYRSIVVSDEAEDQIARLKYLLGAGVKEHLVRRAIDWPGVHSARALTRDHPLRGWWFNRSQEFAARRRRETFGRYKYATEEEVFLEPLPCWRHLSVQEVRHRVKDLIREIEREAEIERRAEAKKKEPNPRKMTVLGADFVMAVDSQYRPAEFERSPAPDFHARDKEVRKAMRDAYAMVVTAHAEASERLRAGDRMVNFPEGTHPPGLPFVPFARGQPP